MTLDGEKMCITEENADAMPWPMPVMVLHRPPRADFMPPIRPLTRAFPAWIRIVPNPDAMVAMMCTMPCQIADVAFDSSRPACDHLPWIMSRTAPTISSITRIVVLMTVATRFHAIFVTPQTTSHAALTTPTTRAAATRTTVLMMSQSAWMATATKSQTAFAIFMISAPCAFQNAAKTASCALIQASGPVTNQCTTSPASRTASRQTPAKKCATSATIRRTRAQCLYSSYRPAIRAMTARTTSMTGLASMATLSAAVAVAATPMATARDRMSPARIRRTGLAWMYANSRASTDRTFVTAGSRIWPKEIARFWIPARASCHCCATVAWVFSQDLP